MLFAENFTHSDKHWRASHKNKHMYKQNEQ